MAEAKLAAVKREVTNKGAVNSLRKSGKVPGIFYIKGEEPIVFSVEEKAIKPLVFTTENYVVDLQIEGKEYRSIIKDIQFDPVTDRIKHFDLHGLKVGQKITLEIPILYVGQAEGVKAGGHLVESLHKLMLECLPEHIPSHLEVKVTHLNPGESIHIRDLSFENITLLQPGDKQLVSVTKLHAVEAEAAPVAKAKGKK